MRWYNLVFFFFTLATCFALYQMKYDNRDLYKKLVEIEKQIAQENDTIKVLRAEWSLLNQPGRIEKLTEKYLEVEQLEPEQIIREKDLMKIPDAARVSESESQQLQQLIERSLLTSRAADKGQ